MPRALKFGKPGQIPEHVKKWWGSKTFTTTFASIDLRADGKYLLCTHSPEEMDIWNTGVYREIVPNQWLVMTNSFADEQGNIVSAEYYGMEPNFPPETIVTVIFDDHRMSNAGHEHHTMLTLKYDDISSIQEKNPQELKNGWKDSLDKLADTLR